MTSSRHPCNPRRRLRLAALVTAAVAAASATAMAQATPLPNAMAPASGGSGAKAPFTEYQAVDAHTSGTKIGPDYTQGSLASEASGRQAVQLTSQGQYVEFTLTAPANAIDVHYALNASKAGTLAIYANGSKVASELALTAKHTYINTGNITGSKTHHFYDDARMLLGKNLKAGDKVRLQVDAGDSAAPYTINFADFEQVAAAGTQPANSLSVADYGAKPTPGVDNSNAFTKAITAAKAAGKAVWVPAGTFDINTALHVDKVTIQGAGPWYSVLHGLNVFNNSGVSGGIKLSDFAVFGESVQRNDSAPENAIHGQLGSGSEVSNLWIQDTKCGLWLMNGRSDKLTIKNNRIQDTLADGINFDGAVTNSTIDNNVVRNTGDDGIALWSNGAADAGNTLSNNTISQPNLANGIALYGGADNTITGNVVADTNALGGGIAIANRFNSTPMAGTITVSHNTTIRAGALDPNWKFGVGALWFDARDSALTGAKINVTDLRTVDNPYEAIQFIDGNGANKAISNVTINGGTVEGARWFAVQAQTQGTVTISNLSATNVKAAGVYNCPYPTTGKALTINGSGNSGWSSTWKNCSTWPPS